MRVPDYLNEQHVHFETLLHPPAFSAQKRAKYLHVPGKQVAKSVLLFGPQGAVLAVLPATHQIDSEALAAALGGAVRLARDEEIADTFRDCEWGVVPPFGCLYGVATVLDEAIDLEGWIVFESTSRTEAVRLSARDFVRLEQPRRFRFALPSTPLDRSPASHD